MESALNEVERPPSIADGAVRRLDPRVIPLEQTVGWIVTAVVAFGLFFAGVTTLLAAPLAVWVKLAIPVVWIGVTAALGWWLQRWPEIHYRYASYIVDSGGTLVNAADALLAKGAKEVYAYITHGVLSGGAVARIAGSRLKELVITDSIMPTEAVKVAHNIRVISIAPLMGEAIGRTATESSVSSLFD